MPERRTSDVPRQRVAAWLPSVATNWVSVCPATKASAQVRAPHVEVEEHELIVLGVDRRMRALVDMVVGASSLAHQTVLSARVDQDDLAGLVPERAAVRVHQAEAAAMRHDDREVEAGIAEEVVVQADGTATMDREAIAAQEPGGKVELTRQLLAQIVHETERNMLIQRGKLARLLGHEQIGTQLPREPIELRQARRAALDALPGADEARKALRCYFWGVQSRAICCALVSCAGFNLLAM